MDQATENILQGKSPDPVVTTPITTTPQSISLEKTPTTDNGKDNPVVGQVDAGAKADQQVQQTPSVKTEQEDAKKAEDNLKNLLGFAESAEQKTARLEREYAASSKESRRLIESNKKIADILKSQGLDLVLENGVPTGLVPGKNYSKDAPDFDIKFKDLSEIEQETFTEAPDKAIKMVLERAKQAFVRAAPTLDRAPIVVSPEREAEAVNFLANEKWDDGTPKHGDLAENAGLIQQIMTAPNASKALKEFAASEPEMIREYLNLKIRAAKTFLKDQAQKVIAAKTEKETKASQVPDFGPSGGGSPSLGVASDDIGAAIAKAGHGY
jgi:hypothetical protein